MKGRSRATPEQTTGPEVARLTPVLLASLHPGDRSRVPALLKGTAWLVIEAKGWNDVLRLVRSVVVPVMLYDRGFPELNWPQGLAALQYLPRAPRIVVLSDPDAEAFAEEFSSGHSFDPLYRPVRQPDLLAVLELAFARWEQYGTGFARSSV
jgi:DNA-binding NarL/FixJ family response regulator